MIKNIHLLITLIIIYIIIGCYAIYELETLNGMKSSKALKWVTIIGSIFSIIILSSLYGVYIYILKIPKKKFIETKYGPALKKITKKLNEPVTNINNFKKIPKFIKNSISNF